MADEPQEPEHVAPLGEIVGSDVAEGGGTQSQASGPPENIESLIPAYRGSGLSVSLAETVRSLDQSHLGHAAHILLQFGTAHIERENTALRQERDSASEELRSLRVRVTALEKRNAVLRERLDAAKKRKWFHDALPILGAALVGLSAPALRDSQGALSGLALASLLIGVLLIIHRLFIPATGSDTEEG